MSLYFAFGSNMDIVQMRERCPSSRILGPGEFAAHELLFPHYSMKRQCAVAGYRPAPGNSVWGVVYDVSDADLSFLDTFEGFSPRQPKEMNKYNRVKVDIRCNGELVTCMTYEATPHGSPGLTSRHYLGQLISGARFHGLPDAYVSWLEHFPTLD